MTTIQTTTSDGTFDPRVWAEMMLHYQRTKKAAAAIPVYVLSLCFNGLISAGVMLFEWELMVSIFEKMVGDDSDYFQPSVMGMAAFIVVITFHFLAEKNKDSGVLRWIDKTAERLAPIYMVGFVLLIAVLLFTDGGIADMLGAASGVITFGAEQSSGSWLDSLVSVIAAPAAILLFSLAIGSLAVFNVFIAHHALGKATKAVNEVISRRSAFLADTNDINTYQRAKRNSQQVQAQIDNHHTADDMRLRLSIAGKVLSTIQQANQAAKKALINQQVMGKGFNPLPDTRKPVHTKELEKTVKAIDGITLDTLINAMK
jgi:hypothetical protein